MNRISPFHWILLALEVQALSGYVWLSATGSRRWSLLAAAVFIVGGALSGFTASCSRVLARRTGEGQDELAAGLIACLSPLVLLDLVFIQFVVFLRDIRPVLVPVAVLASVFLLAAFVLHLKDFHPDLVPVRLRRFGDTLVSEPKKAFRLLVGVSFAIYVFLASGAAFPPQPLTGDEPHYLLITKSLLADGDVDVFNNYASEDYLDFYPGQMESHAFPGRRGPEHTYSRHLPGISSIIVPAYAAGEIAGRALAGDPPRTEARRKILIFASRLPIAFMAALLGGLFFLLVLEISGRAGPSFLAWLVFSFASPLVFYSQLVYPEIPVALIGLLVFRGAVLRKETSLRALFLAGTGIALIPWFGVKYVVIAGALFAMCGLSVFKAAQSAWKRAFSLSLVPVLSGSAYAWYFWDAYGKISLFLPYTGSQPVSAQGLPLRLHAGIAATIRYGLGFLFDQRYGVFPYAPALILCFAGAILLFKTHRRTAALLLGLFVPYWALCSLAQVWGGFCPPGRLLLPVVWVLAVFMGVAFANANGGLGRMVLAGSIILSFLTALAGLNNPALLYNEHHFLVPEGPWVYGRLPAALSNSFIDLKNWIPSFSSWAILKRPALYVWLAISAGLTGLFASSRKPAAVRPVTLRPGTVRAVVFGVAVLAVACAFFNARLETPVQLGTSELTVYLQDENNHGMEPGGFWTRRRRETSVLVRSPGPLETLTVTLSSPVPGKTRVLAGMSEARAERLKISEPPKTIEFRRPVGYRWKGGWLYSLRIRDSAGFMPNRLDHSSTDGRPLGVFVAISGR